MPSLEVIPVPPAHRPVLENLLQLYIHDFSEHWAARARGELGEDGRFEPYPLDAYWREPVRVPLFIRTDGHLAGFALLNTHSHMGVAVERAMAEFFVVRKHRRSGVGLKAAHILFSRYPGTWETAVARHNTAALAFWRKAVAQHPAVDDIVEHDLCTPEWDGPVIRFRTGG